MSPYGSILICVVIAAVGQLLLKKGLTQMGTLSWSLSRDGFLQWGNVFLNPYVFSGLGLYFMSLVLWLWALSRVDVSVAYPMMSLGYIVTCAAGILIFNEPFSWSKILGVLIIILGVYLVSNN